MGQTGSTPQKSGGFFSLFGFLSPSRETLSKEEIAKLRDRRANIAREILQTEETYFATIEKITQQWEAPLRKLTSESSKPFVSEQQIRAIFSTCGVLYNLHKTISAALQKEISQWSDASMIGPVFIEHAPVLKLYTEYVNNFDNALDTLESLSKNKQFLAYLEQVSGQPNTLALNSLLIQPVQRLPRYEMLLADLVKHTWATHPDIENLQMALTKIKEAADYVNESKRRSENRARLLEVQSLLGGKPLLCVPARNIINEKELIRIKGKSERKPVSCIVCNDSLLLWTQKAKKSAKLHLFCDLETMKLTTQQMKTDQGDERVLIISSGKNEIAVKLAEGSDIDLDDFAESLVRARLAYQDLANRLTPHATPTKVVSASPEPTRSSVGSQEKQKAKK